MTANKDIVRICQVGCGYWAANLMRNVASSTKAELSAICELDPETLKRVSERHPKAKAYGDLDAALADTSIDAVMIATPSSLHHAHAALALGAGKHVFVEKPLAETVEDALELTNMASAASRVLMVGHTFLYNNLVHDVKSRIDSGQLGEVFYAYSQRLNLGRFRADSDVMWNLAPHDVSILNYWFDAQPVAVSARGQEYVAKGSNIAEVCFAQLDYADGRSANLHLSWLDPQKRREMVVVGSKKMLVYDDMNAEHHIRIYDKSAEAEFQNETTDYADFTTRVRAGDLVVPNIRLIEPLSVEIDHFATCILENLQPNTDGYHGIEVTAVLAALERSMAMGGETVQVERPDLTAKLRGR
jgi:predicted dehydrogenase